MKKISKRSRRFYRIDIQKINVKNSMHRGVFAYYELRIQLTVFASLTISERYHSAMSHISNITEFPQHRMHFVENMIYVCE